MTSDFINHQRKIKKKNFIELNYQIFGLNENSFLFTNGESIFFNSGMIIYKSFIKQLTFRFFEKLILIPI